MHCTWLLRQQRQKSWNNLYVFTFSSTKIRERGWEDGSVGKSEFCESKRGSVRPSAPIQKLNMAVCAHNQCWGMEGIKRELTSPLGVHGLISKRMFFKKNLWKFLNNIRDRLQTRKHIFDMIGTLSIFNGK